MMDTASCSKTSITIYQSIQGHSQENLQTSQSCSIQTNHFLNFQCQKTPVQRHTEFSPAPTWQTTTLHVTKNVIAKQRSEIPMTISTNAVFMKVELEKQLMESKSPEQRN
jgi:hypothetical protein